MNHKNLNQTGHYFGGIVGSLLITSQPYNRGEYISTVGRWANEFWSAMSQGIIQLTIRWRPDWFGNHSMLLRIVLLDKCIY